MSLRFLDHRSARRDEAVARIHGDARLKFLTCDLRIRHDILNCLVESPRLELYTKRDVIECWLQWNGIIGFTDQIISLVSPATKG